MVTSEPPVRLCCGQRHWDAQCPDGLVMCQLCFDRFPINQLHVTNEGQVEDVCQKCVDEARWAYGSGDKTLAGDDDI